MENGHRVTKEEVIDKLKDDGDFDRLRLKIVRRLKDNEELRDKIINIVKQSAALNRSGVENMKPRQLSDSIYDEIRGEAMGHISEGLWGIIRSDVIKNEIMDTVQSVYNKLEEPNGEEVQNGHQMQESISNQQAVNGGCFLVSTGEADAVSDTEPNEPPGFSLNHDRNSHDNQSSQEHRPTPGERASSQDLKGNPESAQNSLTLDGAVMGVSNGFSVSDECSKLSDCSDDDPPLPPGFG
ncbi:hypothetical protein SAY87_031186 [Trapa incisa]|uniref:Uncharacterized protein n=2 Tax=Trapa TaxID=22665 RepID=A0AAN7LX43_TRANT|nr:hypothetical protein SAY87_031186 [Trapa incisa]KAK4786996.1 hypothetical protein SAY86_010829 [Trapa natans]